jgi:hypothetical protein
MAFIEDNPTTAALLGVLLGALIGSLGATVAARVNAGQAEENRLQRRRQDRLVRLASAVAVVNTIRARLTNANIRFSSVREHLRAQQWESLDKQQEVRRELRTVGLRASAGGDSDVAEKCSAAEKRLSEFTTAAYGVFKSIRGTEDPSVMEPQLERASEAGPRGGRASPWRRAWFTERPTALVGPHYGQRTPTIRTYVLPGRSMTVALSEDDLASLARAVDDSMTGPHPEIATFPLCAPDPGWSLRPRCMRGPSGGK